MPARVLQDQRLVDHRQFEVGGGIVDRYAGVLGQRYHGESNAGKREARVNGQVPVGNRSDNGGERSRLGDQRGGEQHHQQCGFCQKTDQHFSPRASVPKAVPTSIAASEMKTRASANRPTRAIASAAGASGRSVDTVGMIEQASAMQPNTT